MSTPEQPFNDRYIENEPKGPLARIDNPHAHLLASLERVLTDAPPGYKSEYYVGLYDGPTSLAFLFWKLSGIYPDLSVKGRTLKDWSKEYILCERFLTKKNTFGGLSPENCGILTEEVSILALKAASMKDANAAKELCEA